jgi:hypothetical protein
MSTNANRLLKYVNRFIMNHLQYIANTLAKHPDQQVMFDDPIKVKGSPHLLLFSCHGACVGPDGVHLMDSEGMWHGPLKEDQINARLVIASLFQRMRLMPPTVSVVVGKYDCDVNATIFE